jgi:hypothetical protein
MVIGAVIKLFEAFHFYFIHLNLNLQGFKNIIGFESKNFYKENNLENRLRIWNNVYKTNKT